MMDFSDSILNNNGRFGFQQISLDENNSNDEVKTQHRSREDVRLAILTLVGQKKIGQSFFFEETWSKDAKITSIAFDWIQSTLSIATIVPIKGVIPAAVKCIFSFGQILGSLITREICTAIYIKNGSEGAKMRAIAAHSFYERGACSLAYGFLGVSTFAIATFTIGSIRLFNLDYFQSIRHLHRF